VDGLVAELRTLLRTRWPLAALLFAALAAEALLLYRGGRASDALGWSATWWLCAAAFVALRWPRTAVVLGVLSLAASSVLFARSAVPVLTIGSLTPAETLAMIVLIAVLVRDLRGSRLLVSLGTLLAAAGTAALLRNGDLLAPASAETVVSAALTAAAIGVGLYLRSPGTSPGAPPPTGYSGELRTLLRGQWPIAAGLALLLAVELVALTGGGYWYGGWMLLAWAAAWPVCVAAVVAPLYPRTAVVVALFSVVVSSWIAREQALGLLTAFSPLSFSETAAFFVLASVLARYRTSSRLVADLALLITAGVVAALLRGPFNSYDLLYFRDVAPTGMLLALAIGSGLYLRDRDADRARTVSTAVSGAQREERIALARELHDVVAHHVTGIVVQAQAAMAVAERDPLAAHRLLPGITRSGTDALAAMRGLVGTLREGDTTEDAALSSTADLGADVLAAVERARELGAPVKLRIDLPRAVPPEVSRSVLRLLQEALTNAQRHADSPTEIDVQLSSTGPALRLVVRDDGRGSPVPPVGGTGGYGLIGMRERVELLGGLFSAGPVSGEGGERGWRVLAELPLERDAR
jgi:signal transduction histidine kinase